MLLGKALLLSDENDRAVAALAEATTKKPVDPLAFAYLADASERAGNFPVARAALLDYEALEGDPKEPRRRAQFFRRIGDLSLRTGHAAEAVTWLERSMNTDAAVVDGDLLVRLAQAQWQVGNPIGARETAAKALALEPANRAARSLLRRLPQ